MNPPKEWAVVPLGKIAEIGAGGPAPQGTDYYIGGTHAFVRMQDVGRCDGIYIDRTADSLNDLALNKHSLRLWPKDALLVPKSGASVALNKRALLNRPSYVVSHLAVVVPGPLIDPQFLYFYSLGLNMMRYALDPAYPSLRVSDLALVKVLLPPISEQRQIVAILREFEEVRALRASAARKIKNLLPALYRDRFSSQRHLGFLPLEERADVVSGVALGRQIRGGAISEVPYLRVANVQAGYIDLTEVKTTKASEREIEAYSLRKGDILLTEGGDFDKLGRGCLWSGQVTPCIHQNHIFRVRPDARRLNSHFFTQYLQSPDAKSYFLRCSKRTTNLASINLSQLKKLPVPNVSLPAQERFSQEVDDVVKCVEVDGVRIADELSASLQVYAFTGRLTATWREQHRDELDRESKDRDGALRSDRAVSADFPTITASSGGIVASAISGSTIRINASGVLDDARFGLTRDQHGILEEIKRREYGPGQDDPDLPERNKTLTTSEIANSITGPLHGDVQAIESNLAVLVARGLVIGLSREQQTPDTGETVYGNCYRLPDPTPDEAEGEQSVTVGDDVRDSEIRRLLANRKREESVP